MVKEITTIISNTEKETAYQIAHVKEALGTMRVMMERTAAIK